MRIALLLITLLTHSFADAQYNTHTNDSTTANYSLTHLSVKIPTPVTTFYKAGLGVSLVQSSIVAHLKNFSIDAVVEHRIWKNTFVTASLEASYGFGQKVEMITMYLPVSIRQYISLNKKKSNRTDIFRTYIAIQAHNSLYSSFLYDRSRIDLDRYYRGAKLGPIVNSGQYIEGPNLLEYVYIRVGHQFKLGTDSYLDISTVVPFKPLIYTKRSGGFTLASPALISIKYGLVFRKSTKIQ